MFSLDNVLVIILRPLDLKGRVTNGEREIFHLLAHSPRWLGMGQASAAFQGSLAETSSLPWEASAAGRGYWNAAPISPSLVIFDGQKAAVVLKRGSPVPSQLWANHHLTAGLLGSFFFFL